MEQETHATAPAEDGLLIRGAVKVFGKTRALDGVSLHVPEGEIAALLGPSGSGKSTLLYAVAGLEPLDAGEVYWNGQTLTGVPPHRRNFGLMFQDFALFPHMKVAENVAFGLRMAGVNSMQAQSKVSEMLDLVGLAGFEKRDVNTLSGGEQQRVALARSLAPQPRLLMLDEPLGSLDRNLRDRLVLDLRQILQEVQQTAIYVTHDQEEAFILADHVAVMEAGQIEQVASPQELYRHPASLFVARFLGLSNLLPGEITSSADGPLVKTALGSFPAPQGAQPGEASVLVRPGEVEIGCNGGPVEIEGTVLESTFRGSICRVKLEARGLTLTLDFLSGAAIPARGEKICISFDPVDALQVLPRKRLP